MATAAYRAGEKLADLRCGMIFDYSRRSGVAHAEIFAPDGGAADRAQLWNAAEAVEKRKDARTGREWVLALPAELEAEDQRELARAFALELVTRYGVAVDLAIHLPDPKGDERNHHAHVFATTRQVSRAENGALVLGAKAALELSETQRRDKGLCSGPEEVTALRQLWERLANAALERAGKEARIDSRSLEAQGLEREPTKHLGPEATAMERRKENSERGDHNRLVKARNKQREEDQAQAKREQREREAREEAERQAEEAEAALTAEIIELATKREERDREAQEEAARQEAQARRAREEAKARAQEEARQQREQERIAQAAREKAQGWEKVERERLESLSDRALEQEGWTASELRRRIKALQPRPLDERITEDMAVRQMTNTLKSLMADQAELETERDRRADKLEEGQQEESGLWGFLRRVGRLIGFSHSPSLEELERDLQEAQQEVDEGAAFIRNQHEGIAFAREGASARLEEEDAPHLEQVAALEAIWSVRSQETPDAEAQRVERMQAEQDRRREAREVKKKREEEAQAQAAQAREAEKARLRLAMQGEREWLARRDRSRFEKRILPKLNTEIQKVWSEAWKGAPAGRAEERLEFAREEAWERVWEWLESHGADKFVSDVGLELNAALRREFDEICAPPTLTPSEPEPQQAAKPLPKVNTPEPEDDDDPEPPYWPSIRP